MLKCWAEVVGEEIAARTRAVRIDKGTLYVNVDHSAWTHELHFMEKEILKRLRDKHPDVVIRRIRFGASR
ncbi:MAG: DUF721 domain-containing protein [Candidatus Latescibacterota bacterium]|nr:MAG: DUF721 domain-containing protein [Candidatus Latescibacterota bacterium]